MKGPGLVLGTLTANPAACVSQFETRSHPRLIPQTTTKTTQYAWHKLICATVVRKWQIRRQKSVRSYKRLTNSETSHYSTIDNRGPLVSTGENMYSVDASLCNSNTLRASILATPCTKGHLPLLQSYRGPRDPEALLKLSSFVPPFPRWAGLYRGRVTLLSLPTAYLVKGPRLDLSAFLPKHIAF